MVTLADRYSSLGSRHLCVGTSPPLPVPGDVCVLALPRLPLPVAGRGDTEKPPSRAGFQPRGREPGEVCHHVPPPHIHEGTEKRIHAVVYLASFPGHIEMRLSIAIDFKKSKKG